MNAQAQLKPAPQAADDSAKRRQIVEGARGDLPGPRLRRRQHERHRPRRRRVQGHALRLFRQQGAAVPGDRARGVHVPRRGHVQLRSRRPRCRGHPQPSRHCLYRFPVPPGKGVRAAHRYRHRRSHAGNRQGLLRDRARLRHCQARRLSRSPDQSRRARGRRLRGGGRAIPRRLPVNAVQAGSV